MILACQVSCWNYSKILMHQLSSFQLLPPKRHKFSLTVCYDSDDRDTLKVMEFFLSRERSPNYCLYPMPMTTEDVCARAIGKNRFAQEVIRGEKPADWTWNTDVDYLVGPGGLDEICDLLEAQKPYERAVYWPREVMAWDYDISEKSIAAAKGSPRLVGLDYADAVPHRIKVAIGGVQFVPVETIKAVGGYCQDSVRHQRPSPNGWRENKEDKAFRKQVGKTIEMPAVKNLYRMRHKARGAEGKVEL
jgi:hypothetical protein